MGLLGERRAGGIWAYDWEAVYAALRGVAGTLATLATRETAVGRTRAASMAAWTSHLDERLVTLTRRCVFDFSQVAKQLALEAGAEFGNDQICRHRFAELHAQDAGEEGEGEGTIDAGEEDVQVDHEEEEEEEVEEEEKEDESFAGIMLRIERKEERNFKRKEAIFARVLASLGVQGVEAMSGGGEAEEGGSVEDLQLAFREAQGKRFEERKKFRKLVEDKEEREHLEQKRMLLRQRFDPDSEDAQGEAYTLSHPRDHSYDDDGEMSETHEAARHFAGASLAEFRIDDVLDSVEFEKILSALEDDVQHAAAQKEGDEPSELTDVLKFLDEQASLKRTAKPVAKAGGGVARTAPALTPAPAPAPAPAPTPASTPTLAPVTALLPACAPASGRQQVRDEIDEKGREKQQEEEEEEEEEEEVESSASPALPVLQSGSLFARRR